MKQPIRRQLLVPLLTALVLAVCVIAGCSAWWNWSRQRSLLLERQADVVRVLEDASFPLTATVLQQMARLSGQQFVVWSPAAKSVVAASRDLTGDERQQLDAWDTGGRTATIANAHGEAYAVQASRLQRQPGLEILVLTSQRTLAEARWSALWPPVTLGGAMLAVLVPWLLAITRRWSERIESIQRSVACIARGATPTTPLSPDRDDELSALVADIHRLSDQLQALQAELIQSERERLVAQLASGFAHQFRNGVAGASLALQLHGQRCGQPQEKSLAVARKQLGLLEAEIRGMLSLAKRAESPRTTVAVDDVLAEALDLIQPAIEHHGIALHRIGETTATLDGSRDGLRSALLNLLLNAIDACGPGGRIEVETLPGPSGLSLEIRDNGPGPGPDISARMTEPFATSKPEGIGLGLTVVTAVAHDHGGRLTIERDGEWTVARLWLPVKEGLSVEG